MQKKIAYKELTNIEYIQFFKYLFLLEISDNTIDTIIELIEKENN